MSNRIPEEKVELIRRSADIVEVISDYVQLKKQGRQYVGLCPFHGEKTPSFSVSPEKQLYHCFGCGAGGNVFSFLMEMEGLTFVESVQSLAKRANIPLSPTYANDRKDVTTPQQIMREAHKKAAELYHRILLLTEEGRIGREYIAKRGFTKEQIESFQIGVAPDERDVLATILAKQNISLEIAAESGLLGKRDDYYDRFRNRLMFPIWDGQGNVIAFGGRSLTDEKPKYLNSSDSPIFNKGNTLYGLHLARPAIRKQSTVILFEGYVDVIAAWGAGIKNGVATLGTSLTEEQAKLMRRNAEKVIICFDGDRSGQEATYRTGKILERNGCEVLIAMLPDGFDPDDYIRQYGSESFRTNVIGNRMTFMAFKMLYLKKGKNMQNDDERLRYIEEVLVEISELSRAIERDHYLRQLADEFQLSLETLKQDQYRIFRQKQKRERDGSKHVEIQHKRTVEPNKLYPAHYNAERQLLAYMMRNVEVAIEVQQRLGGNFNVPHFQALVAHLYAFYGEGNEPDPAQFIQRLQDDKLVRLATELALLPLNEQFEEREILDYIKLIENYPKWVEIQKKEALAKSEQDPIEAAKHLAELQRLKQQLR